VAWPTRQVIVDKEKFEDKILEEIQVQGEEERDYEAVFEFL
jgi:hypothetical protein